MFKLNNKMITLILSIIVIVLGVTFALYRWNSSENTNISLTFAGAGEVIFSKGQEINATNIGPVLDYNDGEISTFSVLKNTSDEVTVDVNFIPTNLPDELKEESFKYILLISSDNVNFLELDQGNFSDKSNNNKFVIKNNYQVKMKKVYFKLIIYIDGTINNPIDMQNRSFSGNIEVVLNTINVPDFVDVPDGMIPVIYNDNDEVWETVAIPYKLGDVNDDGTFTSADLTIVSEMVTGIPYLEKQYTVADVNGDKSVTIDDYNLLVSALNENISEFPNGAILEEKMYVPNRLDNSWYDYTNKKWANAVLVTSETRENYMNANIGTEINESDILAHYVWVPRYKYKLWNVEFAATSPQEIDVAFESTTDPISTGSINNQYLSHPAFWWDNNSNGVREEGEELAGIWVGKFEMTGDTTTPTVLPNITSLRSQNVSTQFTTALKLGTSIYLTTNGINQIDSHMIKNMEWGAVAYLSHSKYGKNSEITINSNSSYLTGGGSYKTNVDQSTTGNITGIYDMSGGSHEYVMGVMEDNTNTETPMSGSSTSSNSGFTGKIYDNGSFTQYTGTTFPNKKYYDLYAYGTTYDDQIAYNRSHLGDATGETRLWYNDVFKNVYDDRPWIFRGGYIEQDLNAGIFYFSNWYGNGGSRTSFRCVLAITK